MGSKSDNGKRKKVAVRVEGQLVGRNIRKGQERWKRKKQRGEEVEGREPGTLECGSIFIFIFEVFIFFIVYFPHSLCSEYYADIGLGR